MNKLDEFLSINAVVAIIIISIFIFFRFVNVNKFQTIKKSTYIKATKLLKEKMKVTESYAIFLRLAWSDAGTFGQIHLLK
jgi:hypothetical protein